MMVKNTCTLLLIFLSLTLYGQGKYISKNGQISFFSHTPMEDIKADNNKCSSIIDSETGEIIVNALMKSFKFDRALMEEHFNINYVESDKFPKATFKGKIVNIKEVDFSKNASYNVDVDGDMTIHGVTKPLKEKGTLEVKDDKLIVKSKFLLKITEYNIVIPSVVKEKIQENFELTIEMEYAIMKK